MTKDIRAELDNVSSIEVRSVLAMVAPLGKAQKILTIRTLNGPVIEFLLNPASIAPIVISIEPTCGIRLMGQAETDVGNEESKSA